jgi:hypothetical protein
MSILSRLFGGKPAAAPSGQAEAQTTGRLDYNGYVIRAVPFKEQGQFQTAGIIEREIDGELRSYRFVRADRSTLVDEVTELALHKGKLIIDEQGDALFKTPH